MYEERVEFHDANTVPTGGHEVPRCFGLAVLEATARHQNRTFRQMPPERFG